ncbi:MAG: class I SAM-dependent methyltransferase [Planctomycetota bacterium]
MTREISPGEYCHEDLGDAFERAASAYDTARRVEVLVDAFLDDAMVVDRETLDVGCGFGAFSQRLMQRGARLTACDLGPKLVEKTVARVGCAGQVADVLELTATFGRERFDLIVSSECIEHTPAPARAVAQMAEVLRPGGYLSLSTPNLLWSPVVKLATKLRLRPFDGYEEFSTWWGLERTLRQAGLEVVRKQGLHLFPFQLPLHGLSRWCDRRLQRARWLMINLCLLARKPS